MCHTRRPPYILAEWPSFSLYPNNVIDIFVHIKNDTGPGGLESHHHNNDKGMLRWSLVNLLQAAMSLCTLKEVLHTFLSSSSKVVAAGETREQTV